MMRLAAAVLVLFVLTGAAHAAGVRQDFGPAPGQTPFVATAFGAEPGPRIADGMMRLLDDDNDLSNAIAFPRTAPGLYRRIEASWDMRISPGGNGCSLVFLNTTLHGETGPAPRGIAWDDPKLSGALAVCFDILDQPNNDPFRGDGNIYNRPQREIALFYDGGERARKLSPVEFRTGSPIRVGVTLEAVCGGTDVTVTVAGERVFDRWFLAGVAPYECRPAIGGQTGKYWTTLDIGRVRVDYSGRMAAPAAPTVIHALSGVLIDGSHGSQSAALELPASTDPYGRIVCTLTLAAPPNAPADPWDRCAGVNVTDADGTRYEIVRFITPYHRGFTWHVDVTDFRPILTGKKRLSVDCTTYGTGWSVSVDLTYSPGRAERLAFKIENLWVGWPEIGNPDRPAAAFYTPRQLTPPRGAVAGRLRFMITGHAMSPNTRNAAEFMPLARTVTLGSRRWTSTLWKTDNYLNPCRPQGGTWKYDRAGWAPGDVVTPWTIDIPSSPAELRYELAPYLNENRGKTTPPQHWTESQVVWFRRR